MQHDELEQLRTRHPAWRLLAAQNAPLVLSFLDRVFVEPSASNISASTLVSELDDELYALREQLGDDAYPRRPQSYLDEWADADHGWLRKHYAPGADEPTYDLTPAAEKALDWVASLPERAFVGTESRLNTVVELLRQLVFGTDADADERLADLHRRRAALDAEIARVEAGHLDVLDPAAQRDRYQQFARTSRELLSDFRQVEDNFRLLDRQLREQIAGWDGSKGQLLDDVLANRHNIGESDQGRSFRAFYDLLLSAERQTELAGLLDRVHATDSIAERDPRLARVHYDWIDASERTQRTVRQLSEQLRRFLDDQVWLENRRVFELLRGIEHKALQLRSDRLPAVETEVDDSRVDLGLPVERPLYRPSRTTALDEQPVEQGEAEFDHTVLLAQTFVDRDRLVGRIRRALATRPIANLADLLADEPLEHGLAELVGYLALREPEFEVVFDEDGRAQIRWSTYHDGDSTERLADIPQVTFTRHGARS